MDVGELVIDLDAQVRYQHQVENVTAALGAPVFEGAPLVLDPGDDEPTDSTPTWFDCTRYALWPLPGARFMVVFDWQDKECPLTVAIRVNEVPP